MKLTLLILVMTLGIMSPAFAENGADNDAPPPQSMDGKSMHHHHHGPPPPEAFTACQGKKADDACSFTFTAHNSQQITLSGTCANPPPDVKDAALACRPNHPPKH